MSAPPALTQWPAIMFTGEPRSVAFRLTFHDPALHKTPPVFAGSPGIAGVVIEVGWAGNLAQARLPHGREGIGGLLPVPGLGRHLAEFRIGATTTAALRVVRAEDPWPITGLRQGFPVDADGTAVVLLDHRVDRAGDRAFRWLDEDVHRPVGRSWVVGDVDATIGGSFLPNAELIQASDPTHPHHAVLVALARLGSGVPPRTILWIPGPQALWAGTWREEERVLGVVRTRCGALGIMPRLVLALPPRLAEGHPAQDERRRLLRNAARGQEWEVVDLLGGHTQNGQTLAEGVFTATSAHQPAASAALGSALD